jgi:hypothetical protein
MTKISPYLKENKMIDDIIENFDFFKCYSIMNVLNWKWRGDRVTIEMLKSSAVNRLRSAIDGVKDKENKVAADCEYHSSSGGLKATVWKNRYGHIKGVRLEFVLTEWDSDGDD